MRLVVDSNILFAALIRNSTVRHLFFHMDAELFLLQVNFDEVNAHKDELIQKSKSGEDSFRMLFDALVSKCHIIEDELLFSKMDEADKIMSSIDPDDSPFIAAALETGADIWSDDSHFKKQTKVTVFTTKELMEKLGL
jgi:predicted nucleic acid-binding protein